MPNQELIILSFFQISLSLLIVLEERFKNLGISVVPRRRLYYKSLGKSNYTTIFGSVSQNIAVESRIFDLVSRNSKRGD